MCATCPVALAGRGEQIPLTGRPTPTKGRWGVAGYSGLCPPRSTHPAPARRPELLLPREATGCRLPRLSSLAPGYKVLRLQTVESRGGSQSWNQGTGYWQRLPASSSSGPRGGLERRGGQEVESCRQQVIHSPKPAPQPQGPGKDWEGGGLTQDTSQERDSRLSAAT